MKGNGDEAPIVGSQVSSVASSSFGVTIASDEGLPFDEAGANTLFVSDSHLGSPEASLESLLALLSGVGARHLILLGDIVDIRSILRRGIGKGAGHKATQAFLARLERFDSVHYVTGNHDNLLELFDGLVFRNIRIVRELSLSGTDQPTLVQHGHQAERATRLQHTAGWKAEIACWLYYSSHRLDRLIHRFLPHQFERGAIVRAIKRRSRGWQAYRQRYVEQVCDLAQQRGFKRVVCGHIHWPETTTSDSGVVYANCGDWVEHYSALVLDRNDRFWHVTYEKQGRLIATLAEVSR